MNEYPLLCINPGCRPVDHGGPRRTERAWFCPVCIDRTAENLRNIADAWADLEQALTRSGGGQAEPTTGSRDVGLELNERASRARIKTGSDIYAYGRMVLDWADDAGRTLTPPVNTVPSVARWLADWHLSVFTAQAGRYTAMSFIEEVWADWAAVRSSAYPSGARKVETGLACTEHGTSDMGERIPCAGTMHAWIKPQMTTMPDLVCDQDQTHRLDPATWQRQGWKRTHTTMHPQSARRLAERLID